MSLDNTYKGNIYGQIEKAVGVAQRRCNEYTYKGLYNSKFSNKSWNIIEHVLSNGLHVYTVVCSDWYDKCDKVYKSGYYMVDRKKINPPEPYPILNHEHYSPKIITVFSLDSLDKYFYGCIKNRDIDFMIPKEAEKTVLIYTNSENIEDDSYWESYRYVLGGRDVTEKIVTEHYYEHFDDGRPLCYFTEECLYHNAWPSKEVVIKLDQGINIYGRYLDKKSKHYLNPDISQAKTIVDVVSATLNSAREEQTFKVTDVINNFRMLNEKLGILGLQYPADVNIRILQEKRAEAISKLNQIIDREKEVNGMLASINQEKEGVEATIRELDLELKTGK